MSINSLKVITGSNGFIGSHLKAALLRSNEDVLLCRRDGTYSYVTTDSEENFFNLASALSKLGQENFVLFHCATEFARVNNSNSIEGLVQSNFRFPFDLIKDFSKFGVLHLVNLNSYWQAVDGVVGNAHSNYAISKNMFLFNIYEILPEDKVTNFFLYDTYGALDRRDKLVPNLLKHLGTSLEMTLSNPKNLINLSYIDEVVSAIIAGGMNEVPGNFELRHPDLLEIGEVVRIIQDISGMEVKVNWTSRDISKVHDYSLQIANSPDFWQPRVRFAAGVQTLIHQD